jgi:ankyrin repeat protein
MDQCEAAAVKGNFQELQQYLTPDNVNDVLDHHRTVLHFCAQSGQIDCVKWCLKMGADVNARDKDGWVPLHYALYFYPTQAHVDVTRVLLDAGADIDATSERGLTPLYHAIYGDHVELVRILIDRGANLD